MTITVTAVGQTDGKVLFVDSEEGVWKGPTTAIPTATATDPGLMAAAEHTKLVGIEAGAVAAGTAGDAFSTSHLSAFAHGDIATALQPGDVGTAAYEDISAFDPAGAAAAITLGSLGAAPIANGVTNGDSHDHFGGDGAQIAYSGLSGVPSTFAPANHDHASNKLAQANTHESADTDSATSALHHTIGTGGNNAAAGNHTHGGLYEPILTAASQVEMETGTEVALRSMSPLRVAQAIAAFVEGGAIGLTQSPQTITIADVTGEVNKHYICTIAGLTANRILTLPIATAGDKLRVTVVDGDDTYDLLLKGAATVTINGGSAATEWSRLTCAGEYVEFEATSSTNWQVVIDGRKMVELLLAVANESSLMASGAGKLTFRMPYAMVLSVVPLGVRASVLTAPTGATVVFDINAAGTSILSTKLSIDVSEKTSTTAATPAVIASRVLADDTEITIDIDQVGSTIPGTGPKVTLLGRRQ